MIRRLYKFFREETFFIYYILKHPERFIKKSFLLKKKFVLPYEELIKIHNLFAQKKSYFQIKANTEALKIRFNFIEYYSKNSENSENFIEKIYYSKNGHFTIKEEFNDKIKSLIIYNQINKNIFDLELKIIFKDFLFNIFFFYKEKKFKQKKLPMQSCIIVPSFGKTGSITLLRSIANLRIPTAKYEKFGDIFYKINFKSKRFINKFEGKPFKKIKNSQNFNIKRSKDIAALIDYLNVKNKFEKIYKRRFYIIVFRNIFDGHLSANFQVYGELYKKQNFSMNKIISILDRDSISYHKRYNNWIKLFFKNYKIDLKKLKKSSGFYYYESQDFTFYLLNLNNLKNFIFFFEKKVLKKKIKIKSYNVGERKKYSELYSTIKKVYKPLNMSFKNLTYLKKIQKILKI